MRYYAVGGTIAALFTAEATHCFEILVGLPQPEEQFLSDWARENNFLFRDGLIVVHGVPVRLLEQNNVLQREAICCAQLKQYAGVSVRVMRAEHMVALHFQDRHSPWGYSPSYFVPETLDFRFLEEILGRANLLANWRSYQELEQEQDALPHSDRFRSKQKWHEENARLPVQEKMQQLLQLQKHDLLLIAARRPLNWWEKPWDIEP